MSDNTTAQDRATDALLREYSRLQQGDDEAFLTAFAQKLAQEPEPDAAPEIAPFVARPKTHWRKSFAVWSGISAAACVAVFAAFYFSEPRPNGPVAMNELKATSTVMALPATLEKGAVDEARQVPADRMGKDNELALAKAMQPSDPLSIATPTPSSQMPTTEGLALSHPGPPAPRLDGTTVVDTTGLKASGSGSSATVGGTLNLPHEPTSMNLGDNSLVVTSSLANEGAANNINGTLAAINDGAHRSGSYDMISPTNASPLMPPAGNALNFTGDIAISNRTLDVGGSSGTDFTTFSGVISGTSGTTLTKSGAGTLTLGGASTYSGTTNVNAGTLTVSGGVVSSMPDAKPASPGSAISDITFGNSTIKADSIDGLVKGAGGVSKTGDTTLTLNGGNTYTGRTTVSGGTITFSNSGGALPYQGMGQGSGGGRALRPSDSLPPVPTSPMPGNVTVSSGGTLASSTDQRRLRMQNQVSPNSATPVPITAGANTLRVGNTTAAPLVAKANAASPAKPLARASILQPNDTRANANRYEAAPINPFLAVISQPLSTFSIDVDTASYANIRRLIQSGATVPPAAVRIEEMINYFPYHYAEPTGEQPFSVKVESTACPWEPAHRLVKIALKAKDIDRNKRAAANLVFLVDVSGSMQGADRLQLVVENLRVLTSALTADDTVTIVTYAGNSGLALEPTSGSDKPTILAALDRLNAGGSTNGSGGIKLAYEMAQKRFIKEGINRVVLCTDGDFNVGITGKNSLVDLVAAKAKEGVFITVCGYGQGNLNDSMLEAITDKGNGVYHYIDSAREGRKVFQDDLLGTLITVAKDVKLQIEFNPAQAAQYRLIGYDNRMLAKEDFANDKVDAGDIGAGHRVTALYEVIPAGAPAAEGSPIPLKYQASAPAPKEEITLIQHSASPELLTVKLRYKEPTETTSKLLEQPFSEDAKSKPSIDFEFATVVAEFGNILRGHQREGRSLDQLIDTAEAARGDDPHGHRAEFIELMRRLAMQARDR